MLEDPLNIFGFQNVVPLLRDDVMSKVGSEVPEALNKVNSLLTLEAIQTMNEAAAVNRLDAAQVARRFLIANELIEE